MCIHDIYMPGERKVKIHRSRRWRWRPPKVSFEAIPFHFPFSLSFSSSVNKRLKQGRVNCRRDASGGKSANNCSLFLAHNVQRYAMQKCTAGNWKAFRQTVGVAIPAIPTEFWAWNVWKDKAASWEKNYCAFFQMVLYGRKSGKLLWRG